MAIDKTCAAGVDPRYMKFCTPSAKKHNDKHLKPGVELTPENARKLSMGKPISYEGANKQEGMQTRSFTVYQPPKPQLSQILKSNGYVDVKWKDEDGKDNKGLVAAADKESFDKCVSEPSQNPTSKVPDECFNTSQDQSATQEVQTETIVRDVKERKDGKALEEFLNTSR